MDNNTTIYEIKKLEEKVNASALPPDLKEKALLMVSRLNFVFKIGNYSLEYESISRYIEWIVNLPWSSTSKDILDLNHAKAVLEHNHFGLKEVKDRILEYLSVMIVKEARGVNSNQVSRAPIICLVGLVGTGKTTVAYSIAEALGRKIERIPFGGMGGSALLRGQSRVYPDAEPGAIIKALRRAAFNNPVILLDELDRISDETRSDVMGVLVELLDPEQNKNFTDHFMDYPFNLSNVLFVATANNTKNISTAVLDRLEVIQMPSYTDNEKITIAKSYMFPKILLDSGLTMKDLLIDDNLWDDIARPLGYDPGIRSLQRTVEGLVRKVAREILEGKIKPGAGFRISKENIKEYLPQW